jgi:glutaredoxin
MKYLFRVIRWPLGQLVILIDWISRPPIPQIPEPRRSDLDAMTAQMKLYQFRQCPFCVRTRRNIRRLGLNIELRDARNDPRWNQELVNEGGKYQVPCLRLIEVDGNSEWLYGSKDIIRYLDQRFG